MSDGGKKGTNFQPYEHNRKHTGELERRRRKNAAWSNISKLDSIPPRCLADVLSAFLSTVAPLNGTQSTAAKDALLDSKLEKLGGVFFATSGYYLPLQLSLPLV